jgi:hypothetical protein
MDFTTLTAEEIAAIENELGHSFVVMHSVFLPGHERQFAEIESRFETVIKILRKEQV